MAVARLSGQDSLGASTTTSVSATYPGATTLGNTLIASVYANVSTGLETISGWTLLTSEAFSGVAQSVEIWAKIADGTETTITVTGATGATIMRIHIYEYSGLAATLTADGTQGATSGVTSVTTLASGNITTTNANDLLIMALATGGSSSAHSFTGSFNILQSDASAIRLVDADQIVTSTGTYGSTPTWTTSLRAGIAFATLQAAGGVSTSVTQVAASITATGGSQTVATVNDASITQVAANITATGSTQTLSTVNNVALTQAAANLTTTGGTQTLATVNNSSVTQVAANVTMTGGTQSISAGGVTSVSISQTNASLTATSGTQVTASVQFAAISQIAGTLTANGGTQTLATVNSRTITQTTASVTAFGGTQVLTVGGSVSATITQITTSLLVAGGIQVPSITGQATGSMYTDIDLTAPRHTGIRPTRRIKKRPYMPGIEY